MPGVASRNLLFFYQNIRREDATCAAYGYGGLFWSSLKSSKKLWTPGLKEFVQKHIEDIAVF
jgi:hypothetical protein